MENYNAKPSQAKPSQAKPSHNACLANDSSSRAALTAWRFIGTRQHFRVYGLPRICTRRAEVKRRWKQMLEVTQPTRHCEGFSPKQSISRLLGGYGLPRFARSDAHHSSREAVAHHKSGFTLIELSIVLVIIGLIIGGVLVGQDLIRVASLRSQLSQLEKIDTAVKTFRLKYNCMPGDCVDAVTKGLGTNATNHNGNGDGQYALTRPSFSSADKENANFFMHLSRAGLIEDNVAGFNGEASAFLPDSYMQLFFPKAKYGQGYVIPTRLPAFDSGGGVYQAATRDGGNGYAIAGPADGWRFSQAVSYDDIQWMDIKIDDGIPISGNVGAARQGDLSPASSPVGHSCIGATYASSTCNSLAPAYWAVPLFLNRF